MQGRSWMAALTLVAASAGALAPISSARAGDPTPIKQKVKLTLRLDGIVADKGVELVIKPGHPGCRFKPITRLIKGDGTIADIPPIEVETFSADRDCSFAITLKEPGQPEKTVRRNIQIVSEAESQSLTCYVSSRSLSAAPVVGKADETTRKK